MIRALFGKRSAADNAVSVPVNLLFNILFILGVVICVYPFLLVIGVSFSERKDVIEYGYRIIPVTFTAESYKYIFAFGNSIIRAYGVTIFVTLTGTILHLLIVSMFSYPLSRPEFEFRKGFTTFVLIPMFFSGGLVPWYLVNTQLLRIQNTVLALIIPYAFSIYNVMMMRVFIKKNIPDEMIESARIDGSTEFNTYLKIVLPLSKAGLAAVGYMVALSYWNDWWLPLILISDNDKLYNLQYMLYRIINLHNILTQMIRSATPGTLDASQMLKQNIPQESVRMAMAVIATGPILIAYPFFQKNFVKGLVVGSLKG